YQATTWWPWAAAQSVMRRFCVSGERLSSRSRLMRMYPAMRVGCAAFMVYTVAVGRLRGNRLVDTQHKRGRRMIHETETVRAGRAWRAVCTTCGWASATGRTRRSVELHAVVHRHRPDRESLIEASRPMVGGDR